MRGRWRKLRLSTDARDRLVCGLLLGLLVGGAAWAGLDVRSSPDAHAARRARTMLEASGTGPRVVIPTTGIAPPATLITTTTSQTPEPGPLDTFLLDYEGLGPISLGMSLPEAALSAGVRLSLASPESSCSPASHESVAVVLGRYETEGSQVWFGLREDVIVEIATKNPRLYTTRGVHVSSTAEDVVGAYPNAAIRPGPHGNLVLSISDTHGRTVAFSLDEATSEVVYIDLAIDPSTEGYTASFC